jgi:type 2 lantibiotic biosynthesis protein LanM
LSYQIPEIGLAKFYKSLHIGERRVRRISVLSLFRGYKKLQTWKKLSGFIHYPENFIKRLAFEQCSQYEFCVLLGQKKITPSPSVNIRWLHDSLNTESSIVDINKYRNKYPILDEYFSRGLIAPFANQIIGAIDKLKNQCNLHDELVNICLASQLGFLEQLVRRAFVLDLNINQLQKNLAGSTESEKFQCFINSFNLLEKRIIFFQKYPVLFRMVIHKLTYWSNTSTEFFNRLNNDRSLLLSEFGIPTEIKIKSISPSGDTHNFGRSVMVVEFESGQCIVYKPRSTSLEFSFQEYIKFFNQVYKTLELKTIKVLDRNDYGWVEFVAYGELQSQNDSDRYHFKLGFLTAIVYSLNGVDIFFENLIASGADPVIIDLETMFHTSIQSKNNSSPLNTLQSLLYDSVYGIGILPQPGIGSTEQEVFDVSVMGAKKNAKAPYKVTGIENFGRSDMHITEISGWIPDNKSSSENSYSFKRKGSCLFSGLQAGLHCINEHKVQLAKDGALIDQLFSKAKRRLIVRDTKDYGALQQDETHPDLLKNQLDREWHWDNLWSGVLERPALTKFLKSELNQLKNGDIPYFFGYVCSTTVFGGDGEIIDLSNEFTESPLAKVKNKLKYLNLKDVDDQVRIAATSLGLSNLIGITQPIFNSDKSLIDNSQAIAEFLISRINTSLPNPWIDTSLNPVPLAKDIDAVRVVPSDPFLYEGILGVVLFLNELGLRVGSHKIQEHSVNLVKSVFAELAASQNYSASGFVGLSSAVYVVDKCIQSNPSLFGIFEEELPQLILKISGKVDSESRLDFLLGIAGIASALIPHAKRTLTQQSLDLLAKLRDRLEVAAEKILQSIRPIDGLDYIRGFSHGVSGVALAIYRLGELFNNENSIELAGKLLLHECSLIANDKWTDSHEFNGKPLVGWCHGSAGIALAISSMPRLLVSNKAVMAYYRLAVSNTLEKAQYSSKCLCHGTGGNLLCLSSTSSDSEVLENLMVEFEDNLMATGFASFDSAQTMGVGLMTGLSGIGYYLLIRSRKNKDLSFLTLS